jgi:hypothetical protein
MRFDPFTRVSTYTSAWMPTGDETTSPVTFTVDYLVVAGGGGGGGDDGGAGGGGGGAGGLRCTVTASGGSPGTVETALSLVTSTSYAVEVGAGGNGGFGTAVTNGGNSVFNTVTSIGGGRGASWSRCRSK